MSESYQWDVIVTSSGEIPTSGECIVEGQQLCISGYVVVCSGGHWVDTITPCSGQAELCSQHVTQVACETAGCNWYAYPNPFGEAQCFDKPWYIQYLPIIAIGVGALVVGVALLSSRKQTAPMYYPPMYYPPQYPSYEGKK